jgi:sugar lactone lactonase YvrE
MGRTLARIIALAAIAAPAALPSIARADALDIVGSWGSQGQADGQFSVLKDVAVGPSGDVYTAEDGGGQSNRIQRFDPNGAFLGKTGSEGAGAGQLQDGWSLSVDANGVVFIVDVFNEKVTRFTPDLSQLVGSPWGTSGSGSGQFSNPEGIAVYGTDTVYVADRGNNQVDQYTAAGSPVSEFGMFGTAPGQFNRIVEVAVDSAGALYAVDRDNSRVQRFSGGVVDRTYGAGAGTGPGQLRSPSDVAVDGAGNVWVADTSNMRVEKFAADGTFLASFDQSDALGFHPEGLAFGPNGDLYIADSLNARILRVRTTAPAGPAAPVLGQTATAAPEKGVVLIKLPPGASARAAGLSQAATNGFVPLTEAKSIPMGSTLDTTHGQVKLLTATKQSGKTQIGHFSKGLFVPQQTRKNPLTTISMTGAKLSSCSKLPPGGAPRAVAAAKRSRSLFSNVKGRFRTRGRNSAATVRGTAFTMKDTCAGTLTSVSRGSVTVRDFRLRKNVTVKAHHKYLARAPK